MIFPYSVHQEWKFQTSNVYLEWLWKRLIKGKVDSLNDSLCSFRDSSPGILEYKDHDAKEYYRMDT